MSAAVPTVNLAEATTKVPWNPLEIMHFSWQSALTVGLILLVGFVFSRMSRRVLKGMLQRQKVDTGMVSSLANLGYYAVLALTVYTALVNSGLNLGAVAAVAGALMVGIGFGMQNITQNFISGLIILWERPAQVGDVIQLGDLQGRVEEVRFRSTLVRTRDNKMVIVPNTDLLTNQLVNLAHQGAPGTRLSVQVGVAYESDLPKVEGFLLDEALKHPSVLKEPAPSVFLTHFGDNALNLELWVSVSDFWTGPHTQSELRKAVLERFRQEDVVIPTVLRGLHVAGPHKATP